MFARVAASDRSVRLTAALLLLVAAAAWAVVIVQAGSMAAMGTTADMGSGDMAGSPGALPGLAAFVAAWAVMMAAMMLPSAAPMVLLYGALARNRGASGAALAPTWAFAAVYLV